MTKEKNQSIYGIIFVVALVAVFIIVFLAFRNIGTINYEGLTFTKERIGSIDVYHYYYLYEDDEGELVQNNIYLRNNPKKLDDIPVTGSNISYINNKFTFLSINATAMESCANSSIAIAELAGFLANGGVRVRGTTLENNTGTETENTTFYATCDLYPVNPVIQINKGNTTQITANKLCYNVQFAQCGDVLPVVERFIIESIIDAKEKDAARQEK